MLSEFKLHISDFCCINRSFDYMLYRLNADLLSYCGWQVWLQQNICFRSCLIILNRGDKGRLKSICNFLCPETNFTLANSFTFLQRSGAASSICFVVFLVVLSCVSMLVISCCVVILDLCPFLFKQIETVGSFPWSVQQQRQSFRPNQQS